MSEESIQNPTFLLKSTLVFVALMICLFPSYSASSKNALSKTVIKNARIFDGEKIIPVGTVVFDKNAITEVGQNVPIPDRAKVIEGRGRTLLPGLIDSHVHIWDAENLKQSLVFGVTTVVDMSMNINIMAKIKKMQSSGKAHGMAHLLSAGTLATAPGGHGTQLITIPTITKPEEAQAFVEARIAEGSDFIKIIYDNGSAYSMSYPTLSLATISALIEAAHRREKLVISHAATLQNCIDVLEAGVDGLAHLYFNNAFDPEFGRLAAQKRPLLFLH